MRIRRRMREETCAVGEALHCNSVLQPRQGPRLTSKSQTGERTPKKQGFQLWRSFSQPTKFLASQNGAYLESSMREVMILATAKKIHPLTLSLQPPDSLPPVWPLFWTAGFVDLLSLIFVPCCISDLFHLYISIVSHILLRAPILNCICAEIFFVFPNCPCHLGVSIHLICAIEVYFSVNPL